jgi:hypothetical protein
MSGAKKIVTEVDFRVPKYRNAKPEDYEFRDDGALVRKDRWEMGVLEIARLMGYETRKSFEIDLLVFSVEQLIEQAKKEKVTPIAYDEFPK